MSPELRRSNSAGFNPRRRAASNKPLIGAPRLFLITALLAGQDSIREVIAFPRTGPAAASIRSPTPAPITAQQRRESGIDVKPDPGRPDDLPGFPVALTTAG